MESSHAVDAAVVTVDDSSAAADTVLVSGDGDRLVMPRSAIKPIQAVPLVTSGAADAFNVSQAELALACASHNAEPAHVERVLAWLERIGFSPDTLECGPQRPVFEPAADQMVLDGEDPGRQHNNCSGKHTGFLAVCAHLDIDPAGYLNADHPLQRDWVTPAIEEFCQTSVQGQQPGVDGCGIPVWSVPLRSLAAGWARLAHTDQGRRIFAAMMAEPFFVAGTGRSCTDFMTRATRPVAAKVGAEGVYCAVIPSGPGDGSALGVAVKASDGARRAAEVAMAALLERFGVLEPTQWPLENLAGVQVGQMVAVER